MPKLLSSKLERCQICLNEKLESIIFFGNIPPVNQMFEVGDENQEQTYFPLELVRCLSCSHVQINRIVNTKVLFPKSYPYLTGTTKILKDNFEDLFKEIKRFNLLKENDLIIDIGSNDGTLLESFKRQGFEVLGLEPSQAAQKAKEKKINTIQAYFNDKLVDKILKTHEKPKIITATNVFAHIENPNNLVKQVTRLMKKDSIFITESHYLCSLIKTLQYDTVYHEHLRYYHVGALKRLFEKHQLEIFHVKKIPTHGGSIRVYAGRKNMYKKTKDLINILKYESKIGISKDKIYLNFKNKVIKSKISLIELLINLKKKKKVIFGVGAPSRASTLINFVGIDENFVDCIMEVSDSNKLDKYIPGTRIPVVDENIYLKKNPDFLIIFSWHIKDELIEIFRKKGFKGKFIVPLPIPRII